MFEPQKSSIIRTPAAVKRKAAHVYMPRVRQELSCANSNSKHCRRHLEPENQMITPGLKIPAELPADPNCNFHLKAKFLFGQMGKVLANHFTVSQTALLN